jgi:hypothetical protein
MFNSTLLNHIDALKARLDRLCPLPLELVDNLREIYDIGLTYHSNTIVAWQASGEDTALKETIAKCVESSLVEIFSLAGEA